MTQILSLQYWKRFFGELPNKLLWFSVIVPVLFALLGLLLRFGFSEENTRSVLNALATTQAGVLAIVFSVTVLGIQLIAQRYSPRMIHLFTDASVFRYTFVVFVFSIGVDLLLLYNVPESASSFTVGVYFAGGLAIVAVGSLYVFITEILERSTPEGILKAFAADLQPKKYYAQVEAMIEDGVGTVHPLHPLYSLIMSAISSSEWTTAERGLNRFEHVATRTISELSGTGDLQLRGSTQESKELVKKPLDEFLPEIAIHAFEHGENELLKEAISVITEIGVTGVDNYRSFIAADAAWGVSNAIREAPNDTEGNSFRKEGFSAFAKLLKATSKQPDPRNLNRVLSAADHQKDLIFRRNLDKWAMDDFMLRYFDGTLKDIHSNILDYYGSHLPELDVDWTWQFTPHDRANEELVRAFLEWRNSYVKTSNQILKYRKENGEYPIAVANYSSSWKRVCLDAAKTPAEEYAVLLCQAFIETAYEDYLINQDTKWLWPDRLARVMWNSDPIVVQKAFERLQSEGRTGVVTREGHGLPSQKVDEGKAKYQKVCESFTGGSPLGFSEWVANFEEQTNDRYYSLLDSDDK
ncbi:DUF2254 family protein [Halovivax limisalsi]|uniref:DUF2254 family protein n=1 Tax=Halovivax limisalsi TaxID=1453760 RepID=UPI001FFDB602|nr:DUF2254 family protein [Halovivax limisalsi]